MRRTRRYGPLLAGLSLLFVLPADASSAPAPASAFESESGVASAKHVAGQQERPFGAECRTSVEGSRVTAYCHNPYPETDHVRLHVECDRWWDIDTDATPVPAGPAMTVRLSGRCWKEVGSAWVTHHPEPGGDRP
ncbi:hypothetical protein [Streptomyces indicus]|uniref:hypothetical protein n=1 Tax=Streptomyces indicus TaxID=417292 RepID=UPI000B885778|nr:hypothetical protein [Streptomyces indicus]